MNAQQLEYVRIQLRAALVDDSGGTKGQLEAFAEHPPADKNRNPRQRVHVVELDNGRGGVRRVKAENSALSVLETRNRRRPIALINDKAFSSCRWRRAFLRLNKSQQAWIDYCYFGDLNYKNQVVICSRVWQILTSTSLYADTSSKIKKTLPAMVWLAAQETTYEINKSQVKRLTSANLAKLAGVSRASWYRVYKPLWDFMLYAFKRLDEDMLIFLSESITTG
ncbi:hypothetical protein CIW69_01475 [Enterobacter cloacae]|nr:hypothetical protein CIW69_01475 [Enterobacter cloacae]